MSPHHANTLRFLALAAFVAGLTGSAPAAAGWDPLFDTAQYFCEGHVDSTARFGSPRALVVTDLNGDGRPDVLTGDTVNGTLGVAYLPHTLDSGQLQMFAPNLRPAIYVDEPTVDMAVADFPLEGAKTLIRIAGVPPGWNGIRTSQWNGEGFGPEKARTMGPLRLISIGDVNYDGKPDVVIGYGSTYIGIKVLLSVNSDSLSPYVSYIAPDSRADPAAEPKAMCLADATGDGLLDAVLSGTDSFGGSSLFLIPGISTSGTFGMAIDIPTEEVCTGIVVANLNGDAYPDIVVCSPLHDHVSVYFGTGGGSFAAPIHYSMPIVPGSLCLGDVDNDGDLDIVAVTNDPTNTTTSVGVMRNLGNGVFGPATFYSGLPGAWRAVLADMDLDGHLDLVATLYGSGSNERTHTMGILLNDGTGGFRSPTSSVDAAASAAEVLGDFNRDGIPDLAFASPSGIFLALGQGDGNFASPTTISPLAGVTRLVAVDFDRNGTLDLLLADSGSTVCLSNDGSGVFSVAPDLTMGLDQPVMAVFDMNRDGLPDVLAGTNGTVIPYICSSIDGIPGVTTYSFQAHQGLLTFADVADWVIGDFNRDGIPDIALAGINWFNTYLGSGTGDFVLPWSAPPGRDYTAMCAADFDRDGILDIALRENVTFDKVPYPEVLNRGIDLFHGVGDGTFTRVNSFFTTEGRGWTLGAWDANRDGLPDLIAAGATDAAAGADHQASMDLLLNGDANEFGMQVGYALGTLPPDGPLMPVPSHRVLTGDVNRDGVPDLLPAVMGGTGGVILPVLATPPERGIDLQNSVYYPTIVAPISVAVGDLNRDGRPDVVVGSMSTNVGVAVSLGNGDGTLQTGTTLLQSYYTKRVALADFNRDGILDIAASNPNLGAPRVSTMLGNGDGTFGVRNDYFVAAGNDFEIGDMNRDGIADVVTFAQDSVRVLLGTGSGTFTAGPSVALPGLPLYDLDLADLNRDGCLDVVVACGGVKVLYGGPGGPVGTLGAPIALPGTLSSCQVVCVADFNRDGFPDIAAGDGTTCDVFWGAAVSPFASFAVTTLPFTALDMKAGTPGANGVPYIYASYNNDGLTLLSVAPNGTLDVAGSYHITNTPTEIALGDLDRDGLTDVVGVGDGGQTIAVALHGLGAVSAVEGPPPAPAAPHASLLQNYPNPFNPRTIIRFTLPRAERAQLRVFDVRGRLVATLLDGLEPAGERSVGWDGRDRDGHEVGSGVYLYRLSTESGETRSRRMVVVK